MARMTGIIFSDLGKAASFMALEWVQSALKQCLGYSPFPATLNVHPKGVEDAQIWQRVHERSAGLPLVSPRDGFCNARVYPIELLEHAGPAAGKISGAVLVPEVKNYPSDKIEIVAPVHLKERLGVRDGDQLTWEFHN
jgi:CTP-dependent riboflavin kinase